LTFYTGINLLKIHEKNGRTVIQGHLERENVMGELSRLQQEKPLAKRILWRLAKKALGKIPIVGPAYELLDEVVLSSIAAQKQEQVNHLVRLMYDKLEPLLRQLETLPAAELADEALETRLETKEIVAQLAALQDAVVARQQEFSDVTGYLRAQVAQHEKEIASLTSEVAKLGQALDIGGHFKYISQSVKHRIAVPGSVRELYDQFAKISDAGGQGVLYRAHRMGTPSASTVAVKVLKQKRTDDTRAIQRFLLEGFLSSHLIHPNIVRVSDYGGFFAADEYFIEMEDLGDVTLKKWCEQHHFDGSNVDTYLALIVQGLNALDAIHKEGLVHRDVKPSNFMVTNGTTLKLIDFGSVKSLEMQESLKSGRTLTVTGDIIGTPVYMSPEQFDPKFARISAATDIYCLGVTMYEMFSGQLPFSGSSMVEYGTAHIKSTPPDPQEKNARVPAWLNTLILHMLHKQPQDRASLEEVRATLEAHRSETLTSVMTRAQELLGELGRGGISEHLETTLRQTESDLRNRLASSEQQVQSQLEQVVVNLHMAVDQAKEEERLQQLVLAHSFDPRLCPNLRCQTPLQPDLRECPKCGTLWEIECVCERRERNKYLWNECQKCWQKRKITLEHKQKYALRVTLSKCLEDGEYAEAMAYLGCFPSIGQDADIGAWKEKVSQGYKENRQQSYDHMLAELNVQVQSVLEAAAEAQKRQEEERRKREEEERQQHLAALGQRIRDDALVAAFEYYRDVFPAYLKNAVTEAAKGHICDKINQYDLNKAAELLQAQKYEEALSCVDTQHIPADYRTPKIETLAEKIRTAWHEQKRKQAEERKLREKVGQAVDKILQHGFTFLQEAAYSCGWITQSVLEFRHDSTGMEFVYIPGGSFMMGSKENLRETPVHKVNLSPYLIAKYPVTQAQWHSVMSNKPSYFTGLKRPVEQVSWHDCQEFCQKTGLQLPTEAQWEFACRAGSPSQYCFGDDVSLLGEYAWYDGNSTGETHVVGQKKPNAFGLYDMLGNVWEWCLDCYRDYPGGKMTDPMITSGSSTAYRGGGWCSTATDCRSAARGMSLPTDRSNYLGFRCALAL
jgi:formylglycine-generating enzyme required for sulfatase activity/serine/threonine protein kinase